MARTGRIGCRFGGLAGIVGRDGGGGAGAFASGGGAAEAGALAAASAEGEGAARVGTATFVTSTQVKCTVPACGADCVRTTRVTVATAAAAGAPLDSGVLFTLFEQNLPPTVAAVDPESVAGRGSYADIDITFVGEQIIILTGRNFAPTVGVSYPNGGVLMSRQCSWGDGHHLTTASFTDGNEVRCAAPHAGSTPPAVIGATTLTVTNGEGSGGASAPIPFTFYNGTAPPTLTAISPHVTPFSSPPIVMVNGSNFAPLGADRLRCVFVAPPGSPRVTGATDLPATFVSDTAVRCAAPEAPAGAHPAVGVVLGGSGAAAGFAQSTYVNPATTRGHACVPGPRGAPAATAARTTRGGPFRSAPREARRFPAAAAPTGAATDGAAPRARPRDRRGSRVAVPRPHGRCRRLRRPDRRHARPS